MTTWTKKLTRFTSLMVALGLLLGLTVTGCSEKDREGGRNIDLAGILYNFALISGTPKADFDAATVVLKAYDANGIEVTAEQVTQVVAEHKDITPEAMVGTIVYEGVATVDTTATKLVLSYYDAEMNEVGTADVLDNVTITDGMTLDFTVEEEPATEITWDPATEAQTIKVNEEKTITAKDGDVDLNVLLTIAEDETRVSVNGATITGVEVTADAETVEVTATIIDAEGQPVLDADGQPISKTYNYTVEAAAPVVTWTPDSKDPIELSISASDTQTITATLGDTPLDVVLAPSTGAESFITIDDETDTITPVAVNDETVTVTATAFDGADELGAVTYTINVVD